MKNFARIVIILFLIWVSKNVFYDEITDIKNRKIENRENRNLVINDMREMAKENRERIIQIENRLNEFIKNQSNGKGQSR